MLKKADNSWGRIVSGLAIFTLCFSPLSAKEIHSNGLGGGRWSEAATWHGGAVPTAAD